MTRRPVLKLVQGNPDAPLPVRLAGRSGPVTVIRLASEPDVVTLAAMTEGNGTPIGTLTLPFCCMDMQDAEWLRERGERLLRYSARLELLH